MRANGEQSDASLRKTARRQRVKHDVLCSESQAHAGQSQECEESCAEKEKWRSRRCSPFSPFAPTPNVLRVVFANARANDLDGEREAEQLRDAAALATARAYCKRLPDYCDYVRIELRRLLGLAVSRTRECSCVCRTAPSLRR